ncbi:nuclear transport factor 2 family protein [Leadbetterella byssophila]|uniref:nuclear transport factor 2 family protein n=1 Tax=Leadbetterella byssophila TaxID=316068 RepID=UPI0039A2CFB8
MKTLIIMLSALFMAGDPVKEVENRVEELRQLMLNPNKAQLEKITHPDLSYGHSSSKVESRAEFVETLVTKKSDFKRIDLKEQKINVVGNTAVVRHILDADTFDGGVPGSIKLHILTVWTKEKGAWILVARQAVKLPQ